MNKGATIGLITRSAGVPGAGAFSLPYQARTQEADMARSKSKDVSPPLLSVIPEPYSWTQDAQEAITQHLGLNIRTKNKACQKALDALASVLGSYKTWMEHEKGYPRLVNRKAELRKAIPVLQQAQDMLSGLSTAALLDLKNFGMMPMIDVERLRWDAHTSLTHMLLFMTRANDQYPKEQRGRSISSRVRLVGLVGNIIFPEHYKGGKKAYRENQIAFVQEVLRHADIPPLKRLDNHLSLK
jgi:hypothetical protein